MDISLTFLKLRKLTDSRPYLVEQMVVCFSGLQSFPGETVPKNWAFHIPGWRPSDPPTWTTAASAQAGEGGFRAGSTSATASIAEIVLLDSDEIQERRDTRKEAHPGGARPSSPHTVITPATGPLLRRWVDTVNLGHGMVATFYDAGHVLGSSMIRLVISQGQEKRSIIFSGDIGRWDRPILEDPSIFSRTDYIVVESTYGDRAHERTEDISDELAEIVNSTFKAGGNIIVPSFALQRTQEVMYYLNLLRLDNRIPKLDIYLDSPLAAKITAVFERFSGLFDRETKELMRRNQSPFDFPGLRTVDR
jgi:metallo-beta-lactamase family protein